MVRVKYTFGSRHTGHLENIEKQRGKYPDVMKDVVRISDIILEVLDARFVEETRNIKVEEDLAFKDKKIIYILNKADLVNVKKIEKELDKNLRPFVFVSTKTRFGSRDLRKKIRIEAKKVKLGEKIDDEGAIRKKVHVGIIGYPNVGKSSLINLITRRGAAKTSKQAGYTRGMQKIRLNDKISILDTPGVIPESRYSGDTKMALSQDAKLGARTYSDVKDPEDVVFYLMKENFEKLEKFYKIKAGGDVEVLIEELGRAKNFLKKGRKIDVDRTARLILKDWQEGKIK